MPWFPGVEIAAASSSGTWETAPLTLRRLMNGDAFVVADTGGRRKSGCARQRPRVIVAAIVIRRQEVRPVNAVSPVGAPCLFRSRG